MLLAWDTLLLLLLLLLLLHRHVDLVLCLRVLRSLTRIRLAGCTYLLSLSLSSLLLLPLLSEHQAMTGAKCGWNLSRAPSSLLLLLELLGSLRHLQGVKGLLLSQSLL